MFALALKHAPHHGAVIRRADFDRVSFPNPLAIQ
jgi:hypothetical protein